MTDSSLEGIDFTQYPDEWGGLVKELSSKVGASRATDTVDQNVVTTIREQVQRLVDIANEISKKDIFSDIAEVTNGILGDLIEKMPIPSEEETVNESCADTKVQLWKLLVDAKFTINIPNELDENLLQKMAVSQKLGRVMDYISMDDSCIVDIKIAIDQYRESKAPVDALTVLATISQALKNITELLNIEGLDYVDRSNIRNFLLRLRPFSISDEQYLIADTIAKNAL